MSKRRIKHFVPLKSESLEAMTLAVHESFRRNETRIVDTCSRSCEIGGSVPGEVFFFYRSGFIAALIESSRNNNRTYAPLCTVENSNFVRGTLQKPRSLEVRRGTEVDPEGKLRSFDAAIEPEAELS